MKDSRQNQKRKDESVLIVNTNRVSDDAFVDSLEKFKSIFPHFVKDREIDFDAFKDFFDVGKNFLDDTEDDFGENTDKKEKYGLSFAGKDKAFRAIREKAIGTFVPQKEESKNWDSTENIFIEGDNLEVLKLLQKRYRGQIKMIYIDPPYNTGKDFVYKDNFSKTIANYYEETGQTDGGIKMSANTEKNGRFHSDWLKMIYPRLFLARNLLKDDGVIFISIDDNEVANLRLVMDEIFGEENVDCFIWKKSGDDRYGKMKNTDTFRKDHEYILVGFRNVNCLNKLIEKPNFQNEYSNLDNDPRGSYKAGSISRREDASNPNHINYYSITSPSGKIFTRQFEISKEEFERLNSDNRIFWGKNKDSVPSIKIFINENREVTPYSVLGNHGSTYSGKIELRELFDISDKEDIFDNPKPVSLIKTLIQLGTIIDDSSIILDFFAGSGTTAHSVMSLNSQDGGNRKYILVQIPEQTDTESEAFRAGYKNIAEIGRERIRRAGEKILEENKEKKKDVVEKLDIGFKSYKLTKSNYRRWGLLTDESSIEDVLKQSELFVEKPLVDDFKEEDVVYETLLKEGFDLNSKVEKMKNGLDFFMVTDFNKLSEAGIQEVEEPRKMYITFAKKVTKDDVSVLSLKPNDIFVCLDSALDDTDKINIGREVNLKVM